MLRLIVICAIILCTFIVPHGQNVYADENSRDTNNVSTCIESPELCSDQDGQKNNEKDGIKDNQANPFSIFMFFKMILALLFVLFLIYFLLKFMNKKGNLLSNRRGYIQNLGGTSLGQNRSIQLVKIGNCVLVVGVGESLQLLKEIDDEEEIREILQDYNAKFDELTTTKNFFAKWLQKKQSPLSQNESNVKEFGAHLKEQLVELRKDRKNMFEQLHHKGNMKNE